MTFLVQFIRFRRGAPEVVRTLPVAAQDERAALERVKDRAGRGSWPMNTDALRVMDSGGRTRLDWVVPLPDGHVPAPGEVPLHARTDPASSIKDRASDEPPRTEPDAPMSRHPSDVGQAASCTEEGDPEDRKGVCEVVDTSDPAGSGARCTIRSADETHDRVVKEHELREDLGSRSRGR